MLGDGDRVRGRDRQTAGGAREAVRQWRRCPGFPERVGNVGRAIAWDWTDVRRWAYQRPTRAMIMHGGDSD